MTVPRFDLERFLRAQDPVFADAWAQLRNGRKTSHWMWFVFPQLAALGRSEMARFYGLASVAEAAAFHDHPVLGERLRACCNLMLDNGHLSAAVILGSPDDLKLRSCVTLFRCVVPGPSCFDDVLRCFYGALPDPLTMRILDQQADR